MNDSSWDLERIRTELLLERLQSGLKIDQAMIEVHRVMDFIETGELPKELAEQAGLHVEDLPEDEDEDDAEGSVR
jgi:hypothetical protein